MNKVTAEKPFAVLAYSECSVTMNGKKLDIGDQILDGAILATVPDSGAEISFNDKKIVRVGVETVLTVDRDGLKRGFDIEQGIVALSCANWTSLAEKRLTFAPPRRCLGSGEPPSSPGSAPTWGKPTSVPAMER